ncbi:MAG: hypothetical protein AB7N71_15400, partial [Phycisphaerae bacterium]
MAAKLKAAAMVTREVNMVAGCAIAIMTPKKLACCEPPIAPNTTIFATTANYPAPARTASPPPGRDHWIGICHAVVETDHVEIGRAS